MAARLLCKQRAESSSLSVSMCDNNMAGVAEWFRRLTVDQYTRVQFSPSAPISREESTMETDYTGGTPTHKGVLPAGVGKGL